MTSTARLTMWDWSWLSHRVPGGAFEDWEVALAEAVSRGFDTIRFDPLPDLVTPPGDATGLRILPSNQAVPWVHVPAAQQVDPLAEVIDFCRTAVHAGLRLILSSWGLGRGRTDDDAVDFGAYPAFRPFEDDHRELASYLDGWDRILRALADEGLLDHVTYVDLNNELDLVVSHASAQVRATDDRGDTWDWTEVHGRTFRDLAETGIGWFHERYPQVRATVSCCGPLDRVGPWYPRNADLLEWHVWYSEPERSAWTERVATLFPDGRGPEPASFATAEQRVRLDDVYRRAHQAADPVLRRQQDQHLTAVKTFAGKRGLPAFLGEGYATPWYSDGPELSWDWIKNVSAAAVETARGLDYEGYTTSNFSEPTFPLWDDVDWHRRLLA